MGRPIKKTSVSGVNTRLKASGKWGGTPAVLPVASLPTYCDVARIYYTEKDHHNLLKTIALPGRSRGRLFQNPIFVFFKLSSIYLFVVLAGLPAQ